MPIHEKPPGKFGLSRRKRKRVKKTPSLPLASHPNILRLILSFSTTSTRASLMRSFKAAYAIAAPYLYTDICIPPRDFNRLFDPSVKASQSRLDLLGMIRRIRVKEPPFRVHMYGVMRSSDHNKLIAAEQEAALADSSDRVACPLPKLETLEWDIDTSLPTFPAAPNLQELVLRSTKLEKHDRDVVARYRKVTIRLEENTFLGRRLWANLIGRENDGGRLGQITIVLPFNDRSFEVSVAEDGKAYRTAVYSWYKPDFYLNLLGTCPRITIRLVGFETFHDRLSGNSVVIGGIKRGHFSLDVIEQYGDQGGDFQCGSRYQVVPPGSKDRLEFVSYAKWSEELDDEGLDEDEWLALADVVGQEETRALLDEAGLDTK